MKGKLIFPTAFGWEDTVDGRNLPGFSKTSKGFQKHPTGAWPWAFQNHPHRIRRRLRLPGYHGIPWDTMGYRDTAIHPGKLTWNLKMNPWKRRFLLETIIFRFQPLVFGGGGGVLTFPPAPISNLPFPTPSSAPRPCNRWVHYIGTNGREGIQIPHGEPGTRVNISHPTGGKFGKNIDCKSYFARSQEVILFKSY